MATLTQIMIHRPHTHHTPPSPRSPPSPTSPIFTHVLSLSHNPHSSPPSPTLSSSLFPSSTHIFTLIHILTLINFSALLALVSLAPHPHSFQHPFLNFFFISSCVLCPVQALFHIYSSSPFLLNPLVLPYHLIIHSLSLSTSHPHSLFPSNHSLFPLYLNPLVTSILSLSPCSPYPHPFSTLSTLSPASHTRPHPQPEN